MRLAESQANLEGASAEADGSIGAALPKLEIRGSYTRNQWEVSIPPTLPLFPKEIKIQPFNQLQANGTVRVPLVDLATFVRVAATRNTWRSTQAQHDASRLQVEAQVAQTYYQLVAYVALSQAAWHARDVAKSSLAVSQEQLRAGSAAVFDVDRALAVLESQQQQVVDAELQTALSQRALQSLTRILPQIESEAPLAMLQDDLHQEQPLSQLQPSDRALPTIELARYAAEAAARHALAAKMAAVPALTGTFGETLTNAAGFVGHPNFWAAQLSLSWNFDLTTVAAMRSSSAAAAADARLHQAVLDTHDTLYRCFRTVQSCIERCRSARAQARLSAEAAVLAKDRYTEGKATQLDLLQADRDAFAGQVTQIQADADLKNARAQLGFAQGLHDIAP